MIYIKDSHITSRFLPEVFAHMIFLLELKVNVTAAYKLQALIASEVITENSRLTKNKILVFNQ